MDCSSRSTSSIGSNSSNGGDRGDGGDSGDSSNRSSSSSSSSNSKLNPEAVWWYPGRLRPMIIPEGHILINVEIFQPDPYVLKPLPEDDVRVAADILEAGVIDGLVLAREGFYGTYGKFVRCIPRPYDLSLVLMQVADIRQHHLKRIRSRAAIIRNSRTPGDTDYLQEVVKHLNRLIRRILNAERGLPFHHQLFDPKYKRAILGTSLTLSKLENNVWRSLNTLKIYGKTNGNSLPGDFVYYKKV